MSHAAMPTDQELAMLREEIEMLMGERQALLKTVGAAAVFVAGLDSKALPEKTYDSAEMLSKCLNDLPEDTLREALEKVEEDLDVGEENAE